MIDAKQLLSDIESGKVFLPVIKAGQKVKGTVIKRGEYGVLVNCAEGSFTGLILAKEVKNLERKDYDLSIGQPLEAEVLGGDVVTDEGYYVISISRLLQQDAWKKVMGQKERDEIITVVPTEANLGGLLVDMHGIKWFIPLSQLAPIHYPRVEDGDQERIFDELLKLLGKEFKVRIINFDEHEKRMILSEREALREEREKIMWSLAVSNEYDGVVSGISSYGFFVTIGWWIEGLVHISEITYGHVSNIDKLARVGDDMRVKIIGLEDGKISLSSKKLKPDPWTVIPQTYKAGDVIEGEVVRYVPYGVFIRVYDDINWLVHLSEITTKHVETPSDALKLWQIVRAKIILLEPHNRKIGLSIKALLEDEQKEKAAAEKAVASPKVTE
jgi:small subunit ribosomal protein S1